MSIEYYSEIARKYGRYDSDVPYMVEGSSVNPEDLFVDKLQEISGGQKIALDTGPADGRFTLQMSPYFMSIVGVDFSREMVVLARLNAADQNIKNVVFVHTDAHNLPLPLNSFDVVYNRRGPISFSEYSRVLKPSGHYLEVGVADADSNDLVTFFNRQPIGSVSAETTRLQRRVDGLKNNGFEVIEALELTYQQRFASAEDMARYLKQAPIVPHYDYERDKSTVEAYVKQEGKPSLTRSRFIILAQKNS